MNARPESSWLREEEQGNECIEGRAKEVGTIICLYSNSDLAASTAYNISNIRYENNSIQ